MQDTKYQIPCITVLDCFLFVVTLITVIVGLSFLLPSVPGPVDQAVMTPSVSKKQAPSPRQFQLSCPLIWHRHA